MILPAIGAVSAADHLGLFGVHADDRARFDGVAANVIRVAGGDRLELNLADGPAATTRVRLRGVSCPKPPAEKSPGEWFGLEAADFVQEHVVGQRVTLTLDPNRHMRDEDGCVLAYVHFADTGESLNELLLSEGLGLAESPPHVLSTRFVQLEEQARRQSRGLWLRGQLSRLPE